jgi:hypothetical protein
MSSDSTYEGEVPHYAYPVLRIFPPSPAEIALFEILIEPLFLIEAVTFFIDILI